MLTPAERDIILQEVNRFPEFSTFGIGYQSLDGSEVLKKPAMPPGLAAWIVIIEEEGDPFDAPASMQIPIAEPTKSISDEWKDMGISCVSAGITGVVSATGVLAAPVTGGASTVITVLSWTAAAASAMQCGAGLGRVFNHYIDPSLNQTLDNSTAYNGVMLAADSVQLASDLVSIGGVVKVSGKIIKVSGSARQALSKVVKGVSRAERRRMARELSGAVSNRQYKQLVRSGELSKILSMHQIRWTVAHQMMSALGMSLDALSSARGGMIRYFINIFSETENTN